MENVNLVKKMQSNRVFMDSMSTRFGLLQTVQSFAQASVRTPEPVKSKLSADLGELLCLMQWMVMLYGNAHAAVSVSTDALNKAGNLVHVDVSELVRDLESVYGEGVVVTSHTIATWADQVLNGQLWERASEAWNSREDGMIPDFQLLKGLPLAAPFF